MSKVETVPVTPAVNAKKESSKNITWKHFAPIVVALIIALIPAPAGLPQYAWYYFAIFAGVIVGLMFEPLARRRHRLDRRDFGRACFPSMSFSRPEQLAKPGFNPLNASLSWALSGFSNSTVWLIFGAFMFALGYEKTGLGRRIALMLVKAMGRKTLTLGYAVVIADTILAPFTPSSTARSGGTIYPVIKNLPPLYDSKPDDPSMRRMGSYIMWVAIAATCVTSSMFLTALAPNLLAVELVRKTAKIEIAWLDWFKYFAPVGILLLAVLPLLAYWIYPPEVKEGAEVQSWAAKELEKMGGFTRREITLAVLVLIALVMWIFRGDEVNATTAALVVISLMLLTNVVSWDDIIKNSAAWNTLAWFATLVALADGLTRVGFVKWFAETVASQLSRHSAGNRGRDAAADQLFRPLFVCQRHRPRYRHDSGAARGRLDDSRSQHAYARSRSVLAARHHGYSHALRERAKPGVLRQRLSAGRRLLAPGRDFRRDLFRRVSGHRGALDAGHTINVRE